MKSKSPSLQSSCLLQAVATKTDIPECSKHFFPPVIVASRHTSSSRPLSKPCNTAVSRSCLTGIEQEGFVNLDGRLIINGLLLCPQITLSFHLSLTSPLIPWPRAHNGWRMPDVETFELAIRSYRRLATLLKRCPQDPPRMGHLRPPNLKAQA